MLKRNSFDARGMDHSNRLEYIMIFNAIKKINKTHKNSDVSLIFTKCNKYV